MAEQKRKIKTWRIVYLAVMLAALAVVLIYVVPQYLDWLDRVGEME